MFRRMIENSLMGTLCYWRTMFMATAICLACMFANMGIDTCDNRWYIGAVIYAAIAGTWFGWFTDKIEDEQERFEEELKRYFDGES